MKKSLEAKMYEITILWLSVLSALGGLGYAGVVIYFEYQAGV